MTRPDDQANENRFSTIAVGAAENATDTGESDTSDVVEPIHLSSTFEWAGADAANEHEYSRESNPTRAALEKQVARLEGGEHGLAFASGIAISTTMLSLVPTPVETALPTGTYLVPAKRVMEAGNPALKERTASAVSE